MIPKVIENRNPAITANARFFIGVNDKSPPCLSALAATAAELLSIIIRSIVGCYVLIVFIFEVRPL